MSNLRRIVNQGDTANLTNVGLCLTALERAKGRAGHLPGMVVMHGPSGYGKSTAAANVSVMLRAYYVECKSYWSKKALLAAILAEMEIKPERTLTEMAEQVSEQLSNSGRPLIIDEMDHLVEKNSVEIIRDLYEGSGAAILLIGEERLPKKLERWERFHGRILDWVAAQPADWDDAMALRELYCTRVNVADDLLSRVHELSKGSVRRICVNLDLIQEEAALAGLAEIDLAAWGNRPIYTGEAQRRA